MYKIAVLVTSAGVASAVNVIKSLRLQSEIALSIIAVDADKLATGLHLADVHYIAPSLRLADEYLNFLCSLCARHKVKCLFPCYSKELSLISVSRQRFEALGTQMLVSPPSVIDLCNDKVRVLEMVGDLDIPIPGRVADPVSSDLPLFSKLPQGSGSAGAVRVENEYMLENLKFSSQQRIYQQFIEGTEYTIDILCDRHSNLLFTGPRKRIQTKAGQSVKAVTIHNDILSSYCEKICKSIGVIGVCNIQFIEQDGRYYFIEINPRYAAGGLMLTVHAGANLPFLVLKLMLGLPIHQSELKHKPNLTMSRYWEEIILEHC